MRFPSTRQHGWIMLFALVFSASAFAEQAEIAGRENRLSFDYGLLIGYLASGDFKLNLNYERLLGHNTGLHLSGGTLIVRDNPESANRSLQAGLRKYFFGDHQRLSIGALPFMQYSFEKLTIGLPVVAGYTWQWNTLFTAIETGFGPGIGRPNNQDWEYQTLASGSLRLGLLF